MKNKKLEFAEIFNIHEIQKLQDSFAEATGVASIITDTQGNPLTKPSNYNKLYEKIIPKYEDFFSNCTITNVLKNQPDKCRPIIKSCLNNGLWNGGASIYAGKYHIANWMIGQIRNINLDINELFKKTIKSGINKEEVTTALNETKPMTPKQFKNICDVLFLVAKQISELAYKNAIQENAIKKLTTAESKIQQQYETLEELNTELLKTYSEMFKSEKKYKTLYNNALVGMFTTNVSGEILEVNDKIYEIFGYTHEDNIYQSLNVFNVYMNVSDREKLLKDVSENNEIYNREILFRKKNGNPFWGAISLKYYNDGEILEGSLTDITARKEAEKKIYHLTFYDQLTQLPNKEMFKLRLISEINMKQNFAVICLGMDKFKLINEVYGPKIGDELLIKITERLNKIYFKKDMISRFESDKFMIILSQFSVNINGIKTNINIENIQKIVHKTKNIFSEPFLINGRLLDISPSIGICLYPEDGLNPESLIQNSESAMFLAKHNGGNRYHFFDAKLNEQLKERFILESELQSAIDNNEFIEYYQPKVNINGLIVGMESLIRWNSKKHQKLIQPYKFIPIAEKNGMIVDIGYSILEKSCFQNKKWQNMGLRPLKVAVNLSPFQFKQPDLIDNIKHILKNTKLDAKWLELEITESGIMTNEKESILKLTELHNHGISISIDDFGTGYSSLSKLRLYPIDNLKIDKSFVDDLPTDKMADTITTSIIDLAHNLGFKVITEGVENIDQLNFLSNNKCDHYQGYYFYKPLPVHELERVLVNQNKMIV